MDGTRWKIAIQLLEDLDTQNLPAGLITFNAVLSTCQKSGQWQRALSILSFLVTYNSYDLISYNSAIACGEEWEWAIQLLKDLQCNALEANDVTCSAVISACGQSREWELGLYLLKESAQNRTCSIITFNSAISNSITYTSTISACEKGQRWQWAMHFMNEMKSRILKCNSIAYYAVVRACESQHQWQKALELFATFEESSLQGNVLTSSVAFSASEEGLKFRRASQLLEQIQTTLHAVLSTKSAEMC
eukprot:symbB.v1.2.024761.t1/scaffold2368.1/size81091/4